MTSYKVPKSATEARQVFNGLKSVWSSESALRTGTVIYQAELLEKLLAKKYPRHRHFKLFGITIFEWV